MSINKWTIDIEFDKDVTGLTFWNGNTKEINSKMYQVKNRGHNRKFADGEEVTLGFQVQFATDVGPPEIIRLSINDVELCSKSQFCNDIAE